VLELRLGKLFRELSAARVETASRQSEPLTTSPTAPILGCHRLSSVPGADVSGRKLICADVRERPQTVLKTAGLASATIHRRPDQFSRRDRQSLIVHVRTPSFAGLAVFLAVIGGERRWQTAEDSRLQLSNPERLRKNR